MGIVWYGDGKEKTRQVVNSEGLARAVWPRPEGWETAWTLLPSTSCSHVCDGAEKHMGSGVRKS